ncbi:BA14K family protein [Ancylobacter mangrovi]|uniref:BA14K family protein n=1 Tax=Ancylobacter mangrovi TaxID=2972472 RepID=UPI00216353A7|nr:BA14K family protein [Ancylobacter mangrovi]MCS0501347.1 BA14K family protein [Ancylobacter mangrovi]
MKKIMIALTTGVIAVTSSLAPASAASFGLNAVAAPASHIEKIRAVRYGPPGPHRGRGYYYHGGRHYYNGYRGYNYYRPGYRSYNGWWYPAGAFAAGAVIGGALGAAAAAPRYGAPSGGNAHIAWCENRYRSYRVSDNTFQPYNGPRQQCVSPY